MTSVVSKMVALMSAEDKWQGAVLLLTMILVALVETAGVASIMPFMAVVTNPDIIQSNRWLGQLYQGLGYSDKQSFLQFLGILVIGLLVVSNCLKTANSWLTLRYQNKLSFELAERLLARYMARPYEYFLNSNTSELANNILSEVRSVVSGVLSPATELVSRGLGASFILALLLLVDPVVAAAIAVVLGGIYAVIYVIARRQLNAIGQRQLDANSQKHRAADEALNGIKELKVLRRESRFLERFSVSARMHGRNNVIAGLITELPRHALEVIAFGGILAVVLYLLGRGDGQDSLVPLLALYAFAGYRLMPALQQLFASAALLRRSIPALDVLHRDLDADGGAADIGAWKRLEDGSNARAMALISRIELRGVSYTYPGGALPAVANVDLNIAANSFVGFVGPTGCGKTTLVDIILGLLQPQSGGLFVDGVKVTDSSIASWQKTIGYVPQQIYISDDTIARNVAFGVPESEIDMAMVERAIQLAKLDELVETEMSAGYATRIGERGVRLSGGQRQRIGIARALYSDPAVLVLDEATSALDGITEEGVMEAVRSLTRKKTVIVVAHRLSTVRDCDAIFVVDKGRIVESGTYDELVSRSKWFRLASGD